MKHLLLAALSVVFVLAASPVTLSGARSTFLVVVDAGHGGKDPGARGVQGTLEKDLVLQVTKILRLRSFALPQLEIILTRTDDTYIELTGRTDIANRRHADLYVSVHANAHSDSRAKGVETWISERLTGTKRAESLNLAELIQAEMVRMLPVRNRGVKAQRLYLRHADMPSALVELGFLTNLEEEKELNRLNYQVRAADAILAGIMNYLQKR